LIILLLTIILFLLYLIYERFTLDHLIKSIPLRISVTGTRGKSSVVRLVASILRENGKTVLAKTTGSEAKYILPDGSECEVPRRGIPSILEQKKLLRKAARLHVDCLVAEIMSIHPENHYVESQQLLKPNIVLLTNVRLDHTEAMGKTEDEIASIYSLDILEKATVFIPEREIQSAFLEAVERPNVELIAAQKGALSALQKPGFHFNQIEFSENIELVVSVARHLSIDDEVIARGIQKAKQDIGGLKIWQYQSTDLRKICYLVNAFAANDPQSTMEIISLVKNKIPFQSENFIGLLNLRADRGDRTVQWIHALKNGVAQNFKMIFVIGAHTRVVKRKINMVTIIKDKLPEKIMETILAEIEDQAVIFGCGNIGGNGRMLIDYWNQIGDVYGV